MKIDRQLLENQMQIIASFLNTNLTLREIGEIEGLLDMLGEIADAEQDTVTIALV